MDKKYLNIKGIPAVIIGDPSKKLFISVHGDQSNKEDTVLKIFAEEAIKKGHSVLSLDLPEHGVRKNEKRLCTVQNCIEDLIVIYDFACTLSGEIDVFGCSIGAYFIMSALYKKTIGKSLFLSPVVDMKKIIENIMLQLDITAEELEIKKTITNPIKTLYWDYYKYVADHPVVWNNPTAILYGGNDSLCDAEIIKSFSKQINADLDIYTDGGHFFYTSEQLDYFRSWLNKYID